MKETILVVGLGNPGKEYERTPHNMGRLAVSLWTQERRFPEFCPEKKFSAQTSENATGEQKTIAILPETFVNKSGDAVAAIAGFYKIRPENIWVAHDDIDIPLGNVRAAFGGGSAGHHGIESVVEKLGTANFWRFRVGIAPAVPLAIPLDAYVLRKNAISEEDANRILAKIKMLLSLALAEGPKRAQDASN